MSISNIVKNLHFTGRVFSREMTHEELLTLSKLTVEQIVHKDLFELIGNNIIIEVVNTAYKNNKTWDGFLQALTSVTEEHESKAFPNNKFDKDTFAVIINDNFDRDCYFFGRKFNKKGKLFFRGAKDGISYCLTKLYNEHEDYKANLDIEEKLKEYRKKLEEERDINYKAIKYDVEKNVVEYKPYEYESGTANDNVFDATVSSTISREAGIEQSSILDVKLDHKIVCTFPDFCEETKPVVKDKCPKVLNVKNKFEKPGDFIETKEQVSNLGPVIGGMISSVLDIKDPDITEVKHKGLGLLHYDEFINPTLNNEMYPEDRVIVSGAN